MSPTGVLLNVLVAVGVCTAVAGLTWCFSTLGSRLRLLDYPNERSLHTRPTPRTGGIAVVLACLAAGAIVSTGFPDQSTRAVAIGISTLMLAAISFADDRWGLAPSRRLFVHLVAAAILLDGGFLIRAIDVPGIITFLPAALSIPITVLYIVWMVNLYNFMDGMDGSAGGMAVFGFGTYAVLGFLSGAWLFASLNLLVAAAATGFLLFNFPPARIFLGDTGSSVFGLFASAFSIWGAQDNVFPLWVALLVFSPFIVDATVTLLRRLMAKEKVWQAHRTHYYQRLVLLGWSHRRTVLWQYIVMAGCALSAVFATRAQMFAQWTIAIFWIFAYAVMAFSVSRMEKRMANRMSGT